MSRSWTLELPHGEYITPNTRAHWSRRQRCARTWRHATAYLARAACMPSLQTAEVTLIVQPKDRRRRDPDGFALVLKWCTDGLVDAGVLPDDSADHVALSSMRMSPPDGSKRWRWLLTVREVDRVHA